MAPAGGPATWAAALVALAALAGGCGGRQRTGPPRSTCAEAAASITQGLRRAAPEDAERASELEPRFAEVCRSSRWRPTVVRCFALARDPAEHRVCARRLEPAQRDEARTVQSVLYGPDAGRLRPREVVATDGCRGLGPIREQLLTCDKLPPPYKLELATHLDALARAAFDASHAGGSARAELAEVCEQVVDHLRAQLVQVGC
jgi:hypothetical protein